MVAAALALRSWGLSPLPIGGSEWIARGVDAKTKVPWERSCRKAPAFLSGDRPTLFKWADLQQRWMTDDEIHRYFRGVPNVGAVFGAVSGHAECIDFDEPGVYEAWRELLVGHGHGDLVDRLVVQSTQTPGHFQAMYRCPEGVEGNKKLALRPATEEELSIKPGHRAVELIETRGEKGYALVEPSEGYRVVQGSLDALPTIAADERATLWDFARHFDAMPPPVRNELPPREIRGTVDGLTPGDDFDRRATWDGILLPHGWSIGTTRGRFTALTRPGKDDRSLSAHLIDVGGFQVLVVFSTNAHPLEPTPEKYGPFRAYAALNHPNLSERDRQSKAAKELYAKGYGDRVKPKTSEQRIQDHSPAGPSDQEGATEGQVPSHSPDDKPESPWRIMRPSEVLTMPDKPMLVTGLIGKQDRWMWAGAPGCGKTFGILNLLVACAIGGEFAYQFDVPEPLNVAYCSSEGQYAMKARLAAVLAQFGATLADVEDKMRFVADVPQFFDANGVRGIWSFVSALEAEPFSPDVLVLDTLNKASLGSKEIDNSEAAIICDTAAQVGRRLDCSTGFAHHSGWSEDRPRGASAFHGDMDVILFQKIDQDTKRGALSLFKGKDIEPFKAIAFDLVGVAEHRTAIMDFAPSAPERAEMGALGEILKAMARTPNKEWWSAGDLEKASSGAAHRNAISNALYRKSLITDEDRLFEWDGRERPKSYRRMHR